MSKPQLLTDLEETKAWEHIDQDPRTIEQFQPYQGIAILSENGQEDGGLVVLEGSHRLHKKHFDSIGGFREGSDLGHGANEYIFEPEDADWYRRQGCREVKVCANAGDLILWDSRTIHWSTEPKGARTRFVTYVCYCPRSLMSEEELAKKRAIFEARKDTTHWPNMNIVPTEKENYHNANPRRPDDSLDPADRIRPFHEPEVTPEVLRLVGVRG